MKTCDVSLLPHDQKPRTVRELAEHLSRETGRAESSCQTFVRGLVRNQQLQPVAGHAHKPRDWSEGTGRISMGHTSVVHRYVLAEGGAGRDPALG